jgi:hypothetical protein
MLNEATTLNHLSAEILILNHCIYCSFIFLPRVDSDSTPRLRYLATSTEAILNLKKRKEAMTSGPQTRSEEACCSFGPFFFCSIFLGYIINLLEKASNDQAI